MSFALRLCGRRAVRSLASVGLLCVAPAALGQAPQGTVEPIYRTAREEPAAEVASRVTPAAAAQSPFNLEQQPGEHPLMPALRIAQDLLGHIDANIQDYQAILYKQERIDGELQEREVAFVKVRHKPFAVHMFFLAPHKGRECVYNEGPDGAKGIMSARDSGLRRKFGIWDLDPEGSLAMKGQKYPITKLGVRALTSELIMVASNDVNYGECEVKTSQTVLGPKDGEKRAVTLLEVTHPTARRNFRFHTAQVFIDNEYKVPIRYEARLWPANPGEEAPLEESYTYINLKVNNGFTDADFDKTNPELFKD
jgi:hypothetical protein